VKDGGVHQARFCVIRETEIPAVLVELLFIDTKAEEQLLAKPEVREKAAQGVCEGLRRYLEGTGSVTPAVLVPPPWRGRVLEGATASPAGSVGGPARPAGLAVAPRVVLGLAEAQPLRWSRPGGARTGGV